MEAKTYSWKKYTNTYGLPSLLNKVYQETPVANYNLILTQEGLSNNLRPTLYDFLCHRAISILKENSDLSSSSKITSSSLLLANTADFLKMPITLKSLNGPSHILKIWQGLLAFHQQAGNTNALLMANLEMN